MVYCCVPFCKSQSKGRKHPGVSFHEFPLCDDLLQKWVKNIRRDKWTPHMTNDRVCGLHFTTDDYVSGLKIKRLKPGSIPTQFPLYPAHMRKAPIQCPHEVPPQKPPRKPPAKKCTLPPRKRRRNLSGEEKTENGDAQAPEEPAPKTPDENAPLPLQNPPSIDDLIRYPTTVTIPITNQVVKRLVIEDDPYADIFKLNNKLKSEKVKIGRLRKRLEKSEEQVNELKALLKDNMEYLDIIKAMQKAAAEGNLSAEFLLAQIKRFGKAKIHYSENIVRHCIRWRATSPAGYEFPRKCKLMNLPGRRTLGKHVQKLQANADSPEQKRADQQAKDLNAEALRCASIIIEEMARNGEISAEGQTILTIQPAQAFAGQESLLQEHAALLQEQVLTNEEALTQAQEQALAQAQAQEQALAQAQAQEQALAEQEALAQNQALDQAQTVEVQAFIQEQGFIQDQALVQDVQQHTLLQEVHDQTMLQEHSYVQEHTYVQEHSYVQGHTFIQGQPLLPGTYILEQTMQPY